MPIRSLLPSRHPVCACLPLLVSPCREGSGNFYQGVRSVWGSHHARCYCVWRQQKGDPEFSPVSKVGTAALGNRGVTWRHHPLVDDQLPPTTEPVTVGLPRRRLGSGKTPLGPCPSKRKKTEDEHSFWGSFHLSPAFRDVASSSSLVWRAVYGSIGAGSHMLRSRWTAAIPKVAVPRPLV